MHRTAICRFRRAALGERSAEAIDRFPQTAITVYDVLSLMLINFVCTSNVHVYVDSTLFYLPINNLSY
jgi:hypothetical protein